MVKLMASVLLALALITPAIIKYGVNRIACPEGQGLMLRYKGGFFGSPSSDGSWAKPGEKGVLRETRGAGVHFFSPVYWERTLFPEIEIGPNQVGLVVVKEGETSPDGSALVEGDVETARYKGVLKKLLGPGRYRINPHGFEVKILDRPAQATDKVSGWVEIPPGYVGVQTLLASDPSTGRQAGVDEKVLQAGTYLINPKLSSVDIIEVGFRHTEIKTELASKSDGVVLDLNGEPSIGNKDSGIKFPSTDGFEIHEDYSAIWGIMPDQAAKVVRTIGNVDSVEKKIILPQISSVLRTAGSENKAADFLDGEKRLAHQQEAERRLHEELDKKDISLLYGLVRAVYVPREVREPIQKSFVAQEETLTKIQKQATAKVEALLRAAEKEVDLAKEKVGFDTNKLVGQKTAEGTRKAAVTDAETKAKVAQIDLKTAELEAQATLILGEAEAKAKQLRAEAEAELFGLAVEAFGSPEAYNAWVFATGLPEHLKIDVIYAGQGTLWTDRSNLNIQAVVPGSSN